ncbi:hypothetical protein N7533_011199 [Penicillium manginii]|jgi:hypothetical protein|uniref:uncharacterized protein n=1 Tax=Penicillium manginii TaxID=203109 RepID=UPI002549B4E5|nr:uncharacterized protein N7533_011199 [Penicillium manginii]KAJ5741790.1 hypothetical protein N7533_011199 [Penicillium manginii]
MTANSHMEQPASNIQGMFTADHGAGPPAESHVESQRSIDPHTSLEDYNRTMLEYTQKQMTSFVDLDDGNGSGTSSRSSQSSGNSGNSRTSNNGVLSRQANGPPPTSASAQRQAMQRTGQIPAGSPNEAKPSRY